MARNNIYWYVVERTAFDKSDLDLNLTFAMESKSRGYNVDYALREDGQFKDYVDGVLHVDYDWHNDHLIDFGNVSVIYRTSDKLPILVSYLIGRDCTEKDINDDLSELISAMKEHIDGFNGFSFDLITSQEIKGTNFVQPIEYGEDDEKLYKTGDYWIPHGFLDCLKFLGITVFDLIFSMRYTIVVDDTQNNEFQKMIDDGMIDLSKNRIIRDNPDRWNSFLIYDANEYGKEVKLGKGDR